MNEEQRWAFINEVDEELLEGGATCSEWCSVITRNADIAFAAGAYLAAIITSIAAIETYLRSEYDNGKKSTLYELIERGPIHADLKEELHYLRRYRNRWVHVQDARNDRLLLDSQDRVETELEEKARTAIVALRRTLYENQWV